MDTSKNYNSDILPEEEEVLAFDKADNAREKSKTDSVKLNYDIDGSTYYLMVLSDNHNKLEPLMNSLQSASLIKNMGVVFLGDQGKVSLPNSKTPAHESKPLQVEINTTKYAIEKSGIDVKKQVLAYLDGNHEGREKKFSSLEIGKGIAEAVGIMDRYAGNRAFVKLELDNPLKVGEKVPVTIFMSHGQGRGGGPGAEADKSLNSKAISGVDIVLAGDTHKLINANKTTNEFTTGTPNRVQKTKSFSNFGTDLSEEEYLLEKGIPLRAVRDGEILRIMLVPNENKTECNLAVDYINIRQVLTENVRRLIETTKTKIKDVENAPYYTISALNAKYKELVLDINNDKIKALSIKSGRAPKYPKELKLVVLSGLNIGQPRQSKEEAQEIEQNLDKIIKVVSKMDNCAVIINGDAVYYKQANLLHRINFPEDTYAYLQELAKKLEPIKDKIIAINAGENEARIMKTAGNDSGHAMKLADIAMKNCQIDHDLVYVHIKPSEMKIEKQKIQNQQVEKYNEELLKKAYIKTVFDKDKIHKLAQYKKQVIDENTEELTKEELKKAEKWSKEEIENILVHRLRAEGKLLDYSTPKGKKAIDKMFPLSDINLEQPNPNLVQNILCKLLGINPKNISINSSIEETCDNFVKITNSKGETQGLNIVTSYKKINNKTGESATRKSAEYSLSKKHVGADIYVTNGEEFMTKERETVIDNGNLKVKDLIHISSGNLSDPRTTTRVYEIRSEEASFKRIASGIYEDTDNLTLTCASKSFESALEDTLVSDVNKMIDSMVQESYTRRYTALQEDLTKVKIQKDMDKMGDLLNVNSTKIATQISKDNGGQSK